MNVAKVSAHFYPRVSHGNTGNEDGTAGDEERCSAVQRLVRKKRRCGSGNPTVNQVNGSVPFHVSATIRKIETESLILGDGRLRVPRFLHVSHDPCGEWGIFSCQDQIETRMQEKILFGEMTYLGIVSWDSRSRDEVNATEDIGL